MAEIKILEINILGEKFLLTNARAAFWEAESALLVSDMHIGKTAHFRKHGIAIPKNILEADLERLERLITHFSVKKVMVVGDLLHAGNNSDVEFFCRWKSKFIGTEFHLIEGNHDKISKEIQQKLDFSSVQKTMKIGNILLVHEFSPQFPEFQITGHIHPGILLKSKIKYLRLPCYAFTESQLLLPAFSEFTGLDTENTPKNAEYFVFNHHQILKY